MSSGIDWSTIDPEELYLYSLRTGRRLPEKLHNHMLLWSFDDNASRVVKDYLEWIEHCRRRDESVEITRRRIQDIQRMDRVLTLVSLVAFLALATAMFVSGKMR